MALVACLLTGAANALEWPTVVVPKGARGEWVSKHMVYNGLDMRASRFTVDRPLTDVVEFYRGQWNGVMNETEFSGKTILGRPFGKYYVTVELTPSGQRTRGQIGVLHVPEGGPRSKPGAGFPRPPRTTVNEDIVYLDTADRTRTISMSNGLSIVQNEQFYQRSLRSLGYARDGDAQPCNAASTTCVSHYTKANRRVTVTLGRTRVGTSMVVVASN